MALTAPTLLHLDAAAHLSPESVTRRLGCRFADAWRRTHPDGRYRRRDLVLDPAPPLDPAFCRLGRRLEREGLAPLNTIAARVRDDAEQATWAATRPLVDELLAADVVLIAAPMYNFGPPAALKAWIDRVTFPGVFTPPGGAPSPLRDIEFVLVSASGRCYGPGSPRAGLNFHLPHVTGWLTAYGARPAHVHTVAAEATLAPLVDRLADLRPVAQASIAAAEVQVDELAALG